MWARGPMAGYSPRLETLKLCPTAVCRKRSHGSLHGHVVFRSEGGEAVASARSATDAWKKAEVFFIEEQKAK